MGKYSGDIYNIISHVEGMFSRLRLFGCLSEYVPDLNSVSVYVRVITNKILRDHNTVVISNINVADPGKGFLTEFLPIMKDKCAHNDWDLEFENVLNDRLLKKLYLEGFVDITNTNPVCVRWGKTAIKGENNV